MNQYLQAGPMTESTHPAVAAFARDHGQGNTPREQAVSLYYAVRDQIRYDPYNVVLSEDAFKASSTLASGRGWCVPKAILLAAVCRAAGIPARLGYADVKNHLSTARMREQMKTDMFVWHGYTDIYLEGKWVKATPAFNQELTDKFKLKPLEFDGLEDSIYHPFDSAGNRHMEYVQQRGTFAECPIAQLKADFAQVYPEADWIKEGGSMKSADFEADVAAEVAAQRAA